MADITLSRWEKAPYVFINGELPDHVVEEIRTELSYEDPDAEWTDAWKSGNWDGYHRLLYHSSNSGNYYFPVGLLGKVREVLGVFGIDYEVEGLTRPGRGDLDVSWNTDKTLRDYQEKARDECLRHGSGVVVLPTGGGKTLIGLNLIYQFRQPTVVFCHRKTIADQWVEQMEEILDVDVARYYGGDRETGDFMVALYQSVYDDDEIRDDADLGRFTVFMPDEVHRVGATTFSKVAMACPAPYRYGFTATPEREDNATLRVIGGTGPMIADLSAERLIEEGWLAEPEWKIFTPNRKRGHGAYEIWQEEYRAEVVENERRNQLIAQVVNEQLGPPTLVTVERINHGERLTSKIDGAVFVHGDASDREENLQAFRDGDVDILVATRGIVGEGFDVPEIASFVVAGGLKSSTNTIQQVGRALRPDTETAAIVDFADKGRWIGDHYEQRVRTYQNYYGKYGP